MSASLESSPHLAVNAHMQSIYYAMTGNKQAWLDLFDDNAVVADPVGISPFDDKGEGHHGKAAIEAFWDNIIGPAKLHMEPHSRIESGEYHCAVSMTATNTLSPEIKTTVPMMTCYEVNAEGKLIKIQAFWSWAALEQQLKDMA